MTGEAYDVIEDVKRARGSRALAGREVARQELLAMLAACRDDASLAGRRDTAATLLLYGGGLTRGELPGLDPSDWDATNRAVRVRQGKGNKEREVIVTHGTAQALEDRLRASGERPGKLFWPN